MSHLASHATLVAIIAAAALGPAIADLIRLARCALVPCRCGRMRGR